MTDKRVKIIKHNNISVKFEVDSRYSPLESIGTGAYGVVCAAKDNRTGRKVAIKKIPKVFEVLTVAKRTYRELKILRHLRHENIISILDVMQPPEDITAFQDVYVVLDLMETDLHHIIHSVQPLSDEHMMFFLYQIMRGLKYIHSANILHRDLKPSNLLINRNCELKIGDFGMARGLSSSSEEHSTFMTEYVATRWYRAPELMLSLSEYTFSIDIWSVGCIFAEMLARRQLFPGKDYLNQLQLILSVVGTPSEEYIKNVGSERVRTYLHSLPPRKPVDFSILFPNATSLALDLLRKLLRLDPKKRITPEEALTHKYVSSYHDPKDEPICTPSFDFSFEKDLVSKECLRNAILDEIMNYHKCKLPIPSQDTVKDALKKLMEDRGKEKAQGEGTSNKDNKDTKEASSKKKKGEDKKRKHHHEATVSDKKKRPKLDCIPEGEYNEIGMSDHDKNILDRWKRIQQTTRPFIHPIRKLMPTGEDEEKDQILQQQSEQIEMLQKQLHEQKKLIRDQQQQIKLLQEQQKALVKECQTAGVNLPDSLSTTEVAPQDQLPHSKQSVIPPSSHRQLSHVPPHQQQPPISPAQVLPQQPPPSYANISPPNLPSHPPPPPISSCNATHPQNTTIVSRGHHQIPVPSQFVPPPQVTPLGGVTHVTFSQAPQLLPAYPPSDGLRTSTSPMMTNYPFSPLTSSEFHKLESQNLSQYSPSVVSAYEPFPDDLDTILNIAEFPMGSGAGYGVGVMEEEIMARAPPRLDLSDLGSVSAGPASASLLRDWLDVRQLDPDDMDALQRELETGAPDMFLRALDDL